MPVAPGHSYKFLSRVSTTNASFDGIAGIYNASDTPVIIKSIKALFAGCTPTGLPSNLLPILEVSDMPYMYRGVWGISPISSVSAITSRPILAMDSSADFNGISAYEDALILSVTTENPFFSGTTLLNSSTASFGWPSITRTIDTNSVGDIYIDPKNKTSIIVNEGECFYIRCRQLSSAKTRSIGVIFTDTVTGNTFITRSSELTGIPGISDLVILNEVGSGKVLKINHMFINSLNSLNRGNTSITPVSLGKYRLVRGKMDYLFDTAEYKSPLVKYDSASPTIDVFGLTGPFAEARQFNQLNTAIVSNPNTPVPSDYSYTLTNGFIKNLFLDGLYDESYDYWKPQELIDNTGIIVQPSEVLLVAVSGISQVSSVTQTEYIESSYTIEFELVTTENPTPVSSGLSAPTYGWL